MIGKFKTTYGTVKILFKKVGPRECKFIKILEGHDNLEPNTKIHHVVKDYNSDYFYLKVTEGYTNPSTFEYKLDIIDNCEKGYHYTNTLNELFCIINKIKIYRKTIDKEADLTQVLDKLYEAVSLIETKHQELYE